MKGFFEEFKKFIARGNVMDMAVGMIIGAAFTSIVKSLVDDVFMPVLSLLTSGMNIAEMGIVIKAADPAVADSVATVLRYGSFLSNVINFLLTAFAVFCFVKLVNSLKDKVVKKEEAAPAAPTTKKCPYCKSEINIEATKCPHCTSDVE